MKPKAAFVIVVMFFVSAWFLLAQESPEIENVAAFARLYGVVRFFYPGDAAAATDWNRLAVEGVARIRSSADDAVLADRLRESLGRFGPGIEIARELRTYQAPAAATEPLVAWRYLGAGATDAISGNPYLGKRTNRARRNAGTIEGFAGFAQSVPAEALRTKTVRLRGKARATSHDGVGGGALWLRVDRAQGPGCFDNMSDRLVRDANWREYVLQCTVADDASNIFFGVMATGAVTADFDEIEFLAPAQNGEWRALPINDGGFEAAGGPAWIRVGSRSAQVAWPTDGAPEGRQFVRFAASDQAASGNELFPDAPPSSNDHVDIDLGRGLKARVTLALTDTQAKAGMLVPGDSVPQPSTSPLDEHLADIVVAWNFYRHFYPYFADAGVDWDARLRPHLQRAYAASDRAGEADALRRLVVDARDGHGRVNDMRQRTRPNSVPLRLALIDSRVVVIASRTADVPAGTVISMIDGTAAIDRFSAAMQTVSGSEQWRKSRAADEIATCANGSTLHLGIETATIIGPRTIQLTCSTDQPPLEQRPSPIAELSPGTWYVDLTRAKNADLLPVVGTLAAAKGVIFDVRGYPTESGAWVLPHLIDTAENDRWMHIAKITGPFGQSAGWLDLGWNLKPAAPRFAGKIVFLTDGRAISYAESLMGYIRDRHLATIVGATTAGTNGNIATFRVPGEFSIIFTGMRVTGHDGRTVHHLTGVRPDVAVAPTIAGVRDGRDEVLTRALSLIQ
jgi:hypothetical protein